ncbi:MAG TPA: zf-HC2 domain-containing protein, partial [Acidimicrobiales bacterium]|nr:zf-HC2 domain-containing protein [Acidimicrobiales bacterium]
MTSRDPRCLAIHDDLAALATGTLTGRDRSAVLEHLEGCPACVTELEELAATVDALMELVPDATPPDGFADRTVALMRAEPSATVRRRPRFAGSGRRIVAVAAVV